MESHLRASQLQFESLRLTLVSDSERSIASIVASMTESHQSIVTACKQDIARLEEELMRVHHQLTVTRRSEEELHQLIVSNDTAYNDAKRKLLQDFEQRMEEVRATKFK